jgi:hypothetical protein
MGGSPKISGGMTYDEQQKLMADEREFQKQQEAERRQAAEDAETRRVAREQAERTKAKAEEQAAVQEATQAEQEAILEAQAQTEATQSGSIQGSNTKALDFYSSLYNGIKTK